MADLFLSDVHLRLDRPERGRRLATFVESIDPSDRLFVVGDLCDFWFATRQRRRNPRECAGLAALSDFRAGGGRLTVMLGNHDAWLGPYYEALFNAPVQPEPLKVDSYGLRVETSHGHRVRSKSWWKGGMESRAFFRAFGLTPAPLANGLDTLLAASNDRTRAVAEAKMLMDYRAFADAMSDAPDLLIFGHVHRVHDDRSRRPRLVVLGDWTEGTAYLRIDSTGAVHHARPDKT